MNMGICPVCNGTGAMPCPDHAREYGLKNGWFGYDKDNDTIRCTNCGGQYMYVIPTGKVPLRNDGTPCKHEYSSKTIGRCLTQYTCSGCGDVYNIDSGD